MNVVMLSLQFALCAAVIGRAGFVLCRAADRIAQATGLTRSWAGVALLATVTSLPELATGISAVTVADAPNIAVGDAIGSCVFNLVLLVLIDALQRGEPMYRLSSPGHLLSAAFGVVMLGFVGMNLLLASRREGAHLQLMLYIPALMLLYVLALRTVFKYESSQPRAAPGNNDASIELSAEWRRFALAAVAVIGAGGWLPFVAEDLAQATGWSRSFVGTLFVAAATSLPEVAVTLSALRLGALDMAVGNLLGSNLFNAAIVAVDDLFYVKGPLLAAVSPVHASTALVAVVMTGLVMIGLTFRPEGRVLRVVGWISIGLLATYLLYAVMLYLVGV